MSNEEEWNYHYIQLINYIDKNSKKPSQKDKNIDIKKLGSWISNQQIKYKTKNEIMANPEIHHIWTNFITNEKYAKYFNN